MTRIPAHQDNEGEMTRQHYSRITDAGLSGLKRVRSLRKLVITGTDVAEQTIKQLKSALPQLEIVH